TPVVLPDSWKTHGLSPEGAGAYRLHFDLTAAGAADSVERPWSLRFDRLCAAHDIALNDRRLHSTLAVRAWLGEPAPELVDIPSGMLRAGPNTLDIRLRCVLHGGLSMPALVPQADLESGYRST
ncbi:MAG: hypothetical protein KGI52_16165, partial [Burkholderiales bacterium]|nr:hypothetical protein [Burkholderiales bacterium]